MGVLKLQDKVEKLKDHPIKAERHTHPSYGSLCFSRITGGDPNLFGTSIKHHDKINLVLRSCEYDRGLHNNWYHPKQELFEVEMSYTQFVELITHMNMYEGVPVTIKHIMGERTPPVPYYNPVEVHKKEFEEHVDKTYKQTQDLIDKVSEKFAEKKSFNKKDREEIISMLHQISSNIGCNQKYQIDCFQEQMDKTVTESKGEIEAFVQNKMYQLAIQTLAQNPEAILDETPPVSFPLVEDKKQKLNLKKVGENSAKN